jgi:hypothetical protein
VTVYRLASATPSNLTISLTNQDSWEDTMKIMHRCCARTVAASALLVSAIVSSAAQTDDTRLRFNGGIGVIPVSSGVLDSGAATPALVAPSVNRNIVRGEQPAGQIWVIDELDAKVRANGRITVEGKGLILGGGNNAGRAAGQSVFATLICQPTAPFTESSTPLGGVLLSPTGDFKIDDTLAPVPPFDCISPMLLIRNAAGAAWFAVGIFRPGNN